MLVPRRENRTHRTRKASYERWPLTPWYMELYAYSMIALYGLSPFGKQYWLCRVLCIDARMIVQEVFLDYDIIILC